jgi:cob(I)alamin adenosyltransferase
MIIIREAKKVDIMDYMSELSRFLFALSMTLSKIRGIPPILVEVSKPADELEKEFQNYVGKVKSAYAIYEKKIVARIKALDNILEKGQVEGKSLVVERANQELDEMNTFIAELQLYKNNLPGLLENVIRLFNKLIDDFNKTVEDYPKTPKDKTVKKLNKMK